MPDGFSAYARVFHPAYLDDSREQPVRWSTVASWTGRTVHPQMQFERIANLSEDPGDIYQDPPWGSYPQHGSIPENECLTLVDVLRGFTSTPDQCYFCLWEGYGNIDTRLYKASARVKAPGRSYLLFRGPIDAVMAFLVGKDPWWWDSPNIWWPDDRAWCVATGHRPGRYVCRRQPGVHRRGAEPPGPGSAALDPRRTSGHWRRHSQRPGYFL